MQFYVLRRFCHLTHHVQDALMIGDDDAGAVNLKVLQTFDLKPQAEHVLQGAHKLPDYPEGEETSEM